MDLPVEARIKWYTETTANMYPTCLWVFELTTPRTLSSGYATEENFISIKNCRYKPSSVTHVLRGSVAQSKTLTEFCAGRYLVKPTERY